MGQSLGEPLSAALVLVQTDDDPDEPMPHVRTKGSRTGPV
jgi:hypothetical protein